MKRTVTLGITSGIAAYKCLDLIEKLRAEKIDVQVIMTRHAVQMVDPREFVEASGRRVYSELFESGFDYKKVLASRSVDHIKLADNTTLMLIAPATANIIAKLAHGIADDFLTTTALAVTAPVVVCPSMNVNMWNNTAVQDNIKILKKRKIHIIEPGEGSLACGYEGKGRLAEIEDIKNYVLKVLNMAKSLSGKKIMVTAGGTVEKIDDVRFIANRSSGRMGIAIAEECFLRGADVSLVRSTSSVKPRHLIKEEVFSTADDLYEIIKRNIKSIDVIFHAAAVSDFKVKNKRSGKISSESEAILELVPRIKIIDQIKKLNPGVFLIGFKAESGKGKMIEKALVRLRKANADLMIANDISRSDSGFESDKNEVYIVTKDGSAVLLPRNHKSIIAKGIVDFAEDLF